MTTAQILLFVCLACGIGLFYHMGTLPVAGENDEEDDDQNTHR